MNPIIVLGRKEGGMKRPKGVYALLLVLVVEKHSFQTDNNSILHYNYSNLLFIVLCVFIVYIYY